MCILIPAAAHKILTGKITSSESDLSFCVFERTFSSLQQASDDDGALPTRVEEPEESAAEKIYATLRECREQADPKRQKGVKMQGYLLKKKEKIGKWKQQYFLLKQDGGDSHLYFYDNPKVCYRTVELCFNEKPIALARR